MKVPMPNRRTQRARNRGRRRIKRTKRLEKKGEDLDDERERRRERTVSEREQSTRATAMVRKHSNKRVVIGKNREWLGDRKKNSDKRDNDKQKSSVNHEYDDNNGAVTRIAEKTGKDEIGIELLILIRVREENGYNPRMGVK
jgi:hypothetical protein